MKKFMNKAEDFVDDMLHGILMAHPRQLRCVGDDKHCLVTTTRHTGKVAIVTGGGSGHLPLFLGYVGQGLLDGCAVGGVFQSPSAQQILQVTQAVNQGAGVLYLYGNYSGDIMNFDMAAEMAEIEDINVQTVLGNDDVASSPKGQEDKRRGVAGIFFLYKIAGAAAAAGMSLQQVKQITTITQQNTRTMGVALSPCIVPEVGRPSFSLDDDEMEIGMGIHGEPGIRRGPMQSAKDIVEEMLPSILADIALEKQDEVAILINGLGATPREELYILYQTVGRILEDNQLQVFHVYVGEFATSMEMAGASISVCRLNTQMKELLAAPAETPFFTQAQL